MVGKMPELSIAGRRMIGESNPQCDCLITGAGPAGSTSVNTDCRKTTAVRGSSVAIQEGFHDRFD